MQKEGFSLHAKRRVEAHDRSGLEQLLRYGARSPIAASRLSIDHEGLLVYKLVKPWGPMGVTELRLQPRDFLRLLPRPYQNLRRHYGVFASRSKLRPLLPPPPALELELSKPAVLADEQDNDQHEDQHEQGHDEQLPNRTYRLPWARLMKRVLGIDPLVCQRCASPMTILAFISDIEVVQKILDHLRLPSHVVPPPLAQGPMPRQTMLTELDSTLAAGRNRCATSSGSPSAQQTSPCGARGPPQS